jgi:hypothetical protein
MKKVALRKETDYLFEAADRSVPPETVCEKFIQN